MMIGFLVLTGGARQGILCKGQAEDILGAEIASMSTSGWVVTDGGSSVQTGDYANQRRFVDCGANFGNWAEIERYFAELEARALSSTDALEAWLLDRSELDAWLGEEESACYVEMTCQTDDAAREQRYLSFIEEISPRAKAWSNKLDRKFVDCEHRSGLPAARYGVLLRRTENAVSLFRDENVPLQTEDEKLRQQYQKLVGGMTVVHAGRERTMQEMARFLEEPDRAVRKEAWAKITGQWTAGREEIEALYDGMVSLRHRMARNAGCPDYREYAFRQLERFDYGPADCEAFASSIGEIAVPAAALLATERKAELGVDRLRPWDMAVDPHGRRPLRPFEEAARLVEGCGQVFGRVDPAFGRQFERMQREGLLDLTSRKGKAPGGYMTVFEGRRLPFIFMNATGSHDDVQTLLHEGGHAFHAFATRDEDLTDLREPPIEFAEVASMGMELLAAAHLDAFYRGEDIRRARSDHLRKVIRFFPWMATVDMFQHWVYSHPDHTRDERKGAWLELNRRYNPWVDWQDHEDVLPYTWHRKGHPFTVPFYYVEYGIAQLGALGIWMNGRRDAAGAVRDYRAALALGGSRPLPELFAMAGTRFDFSAETLGPAIAGVAETLAE